MQRTVKKQYKVQRSTSKKNRGVHRKKQRTTTISLYQPYTSPFTSAVDWYCRLTLECHCNELKGGTKRRDTCALCAFTIGNAEEPCPTGTGIVTVHLIKPHATQVHHVRIDWFWHCHPLKKERKNLTLPWKLLTEGYRDLIGRWFGGLGANWW